MSEQSYTNHFIHHIITNDKKNGTIKTVHTRFPPEPNGYLHIGHAQAICLNFEIATLYGGKCTLRFDDTNPSKEEQKYIDAIKHDINWLGFQWDDIQHSSHYFEQLYNWAIILIKKNLAYVDSQSFSEINENRGTLYTVGTNSPYRDRSISENLTLFEEMRTGMHPEGSHVLRAKIDMTHPNLFLRDPVMYRIKFDTHPHVGDAWKIYPLYDWAHGQSDAIEEITHSLCTLEFDSHRPLYDWFLEQLAITPRPHQYEVSRLNITHMVMSKRILMQLIEKKLVDGWDDPRMSTLSGMRRRGYPPQAICSFIRHVGISKTEKTVEFAQLEYFVRTDLNLHALRRMVVLNPITLIITNYPTNQEEYLSAENNPEDETQGTRQIPFSRTLFIEADDFAINAHKKWYRLTPGKEVRLKNAYYITCEDYDCDDNGIVHTIYATYDPNSHGGWTNDGRKVKGTIHWVSQAHAKRADVRLLKPLFVDKYPALKENTLENLIDPQSCQSIHAYCEPTLYADYHTHDTYQAYQFLRLGYFIIDPVLSTHDNIVFNQTVTLKDGFKKT